MSKALTVILLLQVVLGTIWTLPQLTGASNDWMVVYLFLFVYPLCAVFFLVGAWAMWRHPQTRRKAAWVMLLPIAFLFLPAWIKTIAGVR